MLVDRAVNAAERIDIVSQGLFQDDPRPFPLIGQTCPSQAMGNGGKQRRGQRHVKHALCRTAPLALGVVQRCA